MQGVVASPQAEEPLAVFDSLPIDLLCCVTEGLDSQSVARFAAACSACRAAAQSRLRDALLPVLRLCLRGTPSGRFILQVLGPSGTNRFCLGEGNLHRVQPQVPEPPRPRRRHIFHRRKCVLQVQLPLPMRAHPRHHHHRSASILWMHPAHRDHASGDAHQHRRRRLS